MDACLLAVIAGFPSIKMFVLCIKTVEMAKICLYNRKGIQLMFG